MKTTNINFVMNMTKEFLDGNIDDISYSLDFPYEIDKRYRKMAKENQEYAELIFDRLLEEGVYEHDHLSDEDFKELIQTIYDYILGVARDGFY